MGSSLLYELSFRVLSGSDNVARITRPVMPADCARGVGSAAAVLRRSHDAPGNQSTRGSTRSAAIFPPGPRSVSRDGLTVLFVVRTVVQIALNTISDSTAYKCMSYSFGTIVVSTTDSKNNTSASIFELSKYRYLYSRETNACLLLLSEFQSASIYQILYLPGLNHPLNDVPVRIE